MSGRYAFLYFPLAFLLFYGCRDRTRQSAADPVHAAWRADLKSVDSLLAALQTALGADKPLQPSQYKELFTAARFHYKRQEFLWEYGFPRLVSRLNGPAQGEVERDCENTIVPGQGFQLLETRLYPTQSAKPEEIRSILNGMRAMLADTAPASADWSDSGLLDAARLEIFRLASVGTASFDSPVAGHCLAETRASLEGMVESLGARFGNAPRGREGWADFSDRIRAACAYLAEHSDPAGFDHAHFLIAFMEPLYGALGAWQESLSVPLPGDNRAYSPAARSLFSATGWDLRFFAPPFARHATADQAELGRRLFFAPILSGGERRSCAACHQPERAFTDGLPRSLAMDGRTPVARNAPTLIHAAFQQGVFADLRAESLEDQASMVIHNAAEMGGDLNAAARAMNADPEYSRRFLEAFAGDSLNQDRDIPVTPLRIRRALAAYLRTLAPMASPWDRFVRGDGDAVSPEVIRGFNLFMGKANCASCHFPPLFNGTIPPFYIKTDLEVLGVPERLKGAGRRAGLDPDSGRMVQDHAPQSLRAFKTPTLRNVQYTGPYMHNGVFATLEQVIDFYDAGGGAGLGLAVPNQTLASDSLHLADGEKRALVAFLKALSDTSGTLARPPGSPLYAGHSPKGKRPVNY